MYKTQNYSTAQMIRLLKTGWSYYFWVRWTQCGLPCGERSNLFVTVKTEDRFLRPFSNDCQILGDHNSWHSNLTYSLMQRLIPYFKPYFVFKSMHLLCFRLSSFYLSDSIKNPTSISRILLNTNSQIFFLKRRGLPLSSMILFVPELFFAQKWESPVQNRQLIHRGLVHVICHSCTLLLHSVNGNLWKNGGQKVLQAEESQDVLP